MPVVRTTTLSTVLAKVLTFCRDPAGVRYTPEIVLDGIRDALNELAEGGAFLRSDVFAPAVSEHSFDYHAEAVRIVSATYNGEELDPIDTGDAAHRFGQDWRTQEGTPVAFLDDGARFRLVPAPETAAEALVFSTPTARTEQEFRGVKSSNYSCTLNGSDYVLFEPGDGQVTNDETAERVLIVRYSFVPLPADLEDEFPRRYELGLKGAGIMTAYATAKGQDARIRGSFGRATWLREKRKILEASFGPIGESFNVSLLAEMS